MEDRVPERRKEPRCTMEVQAVLRRLKDGESFPAITLNISSQGLLLRPTQRHPLQVGDDVLCDLALPNGAETAFSYWGIGRVVRVDRENAAIELKAGVFPADKRTRRGRS